MRIVSKGLTYIYNKNTPFAAKAIDNVPLEIEEGEFFGIIGHTGSGKSTFIQHLNGLISVDGGALTVGDVNLKKYSKKQFKAVHTNLGSDGICFKEGGKKISYRAYKKRFRLEMKALRAKVGMVFQYPEYQLFGETVFADVAFGVKNFYPDYSAENVESAVKEAVNLVGLDYESVKDKSPFDLSGGQKRRVAIAGVIVTKPQVLVLDEPVAGLDPQGKAELMQLLHTLHGKVCKTVIIVSHDMDDVAENCTRVAVFSGGKLVKCAPPRELFKNGKELADIGLSVPLTATLCEELKNRGIDLQTDFTTSDFINAVVEKYRELNN